MFVITMLRVLWATHMKPENDWEIDYIRSILNTMDIPYTIEHVDRMEHIVPGALIVINHSINYLAYLSQYEQRRIPFGILHLSDEWFDDNVEFYNYSMCKFAFRNYYHELFDKYPKLKYFALGFKRKFWNQYFGDSPRSVSYNARPYMWSFAGAPRTPERQAVLKMFDEVKPNKVHFEMGNSFLITATGLPTEDYRQLVIQSKFTLCAPGISNTLSGDTFRVTEALECGSIPIVVAGRNSKGVVYWESLYGVVPPFVIGETWEDALEKTKQLSMDPVKCEEIRIACYDFWQQYKKQLGTHIADLSKQFLL